MIYKKYLLIHDKKQVGIEIRFYILDTFKKQVDANCIDLDSEFVDLNYKVASLIFCHFWRSIVVYVAIRRIWRTVKAIMIICYGDEWRDSKSLN